MELWFYGASDDLVECEGGIEGEICCNDKPVAIKVGDEHYCTIVVFEYGAVEYERIGRLGGSGCWRVSVMPLDEDVPMHEVRIELNEHGCSPQVFFDFLDEGTPVVWRTSATEWEVPA